MFGGGRLTRRPLTWVNGFAYDTSGPLVVVTYAQAAKARGAVGALPGLQHHAAWAVDLSFLMSASETAGKERLKDCPEIATL